jgi:DNA-binding transcriptional ArsR family regulator
MSDQPSYRRLTDLDRVIHEPARLAIMAVLYTVESADFLFLQHSTGLTKGNLSSHLMRLEEAGYVSIEKSFRGKVPLTTCRLSVAGRSAFDAYRTSLRKAVDSLPA